MSNLEQLDIADLFLQLKEATATQKPEEVKDTLQDDHIILDNEAKTQDKFRAIQKHLNSLPKLSNGFDALAKSKTSGVTTISDPVVQKPTKTKKVAETAGDKWFNMPKTELTPQIKRDLTIIKHRAALDPKRHYKKDKWKTPDYFQIGTIVESKAEFFSSRMKNKERKNTILETLMTDNDTNKYFKRKYTEVQEKKMSGRKGFYKKLKANRNKF